MILYELAGALAILGVYGVAVIVVGVPVLAAVFKIIEVARGR